MITAAAVALAVGGAATLAALAFDDLASNLPPVSAVPEFFDPATHAYRSTQFFDRSGQIVLTAGADAEPISLQTPVVDPGLELLIRAAVAYFDPDFWGAAATGNPSLLFQGLAFRGALSDPARPTIAEQLIRQTILPPGEHLRSPLARGLRMAYLAADLERAYSREQILEWYLNSAYFGHGAYGPQAAARVYFGRALADLDLAQVAMLTAIPASPGLNPIDAPQQAKARQVEVLEAMARHEAAPPEGIEEALAAPLRLRPDHPEPGDPTAEYVSLARQQLADLLGPEFAYRGGLRVLTSLDLDLQFQAACVAATQAARLSGAPPGTILPAADGAPCVAASLLAPLRPGDAGVDRGLDGLAVVVLDPATGEVLSLVGLRRSGESWEDLTLGLASQTPRRAGPTLYPLIYLTAFATGYSPGSMVLDVPTTFEDAGEAGVYAPQNPDGQARGPIRVRTALANTLTLPAARTLGLLGPESVLRTARQMGLASLEPPLGAGVRWVMEDGRATLLDLAEGYGVIAAEGLQSGVGGVTEEEGMASVLVRQVEGPRGELLYTWERDQRAVLSPQLAYLLTDVLSDEPARWELLGHPNTLEIGRPAGVVAGVGPGGADVWAVGFTPSRVVGVWMGTLDEEPANGVSAVGAAGAVWSAVQRYAARQAPPEGWGSPPGLSIVEVCDPSGLLPTAYCPNVVREVFIHGSEPTHYDTLYQPFRVNRETGKLATLFTPIDLVEERVYLIPPPEAAAWAEAAGIDQPPQEYDTISDLPTDPHVILTEPPAFEIVRGVVAIEGSAVPEGFVSYRLQYGQGLNPTRWVQIGADEEDSVEAGRLGEWDTAGLSGLYTLQLLVVREEDRVATAAVPVTIDNTPPIVTMIAPEAGAQLEVRAGGVVVIELGVADNLGVARVEVYVDRRNLATLTNAPYSLRWTPEQAGEHSLFARAYDLAGNRAESVPVTVVVRR